MADGTLSGRSSKSGHDRHDEYVVLALRCPVCNTAFTSEVPVPGRRVGRDTDLRPRFEGPDPLPTLIHSCPSCRYTAYRDGFEGPDAGEEEDELLVRLVGYRAPVRFLPPAEEDLESLRRWIRGGELTRGIAEGREPFGAERYLLGARCFEYLLDDEPLGTADYVLRAAWCARVLGTAELERQCLGEAVRRLRDAVDTGQVPEAEKPRALYLLGELARRAGDFARAVDVFSLIETSVEPDEEESALFVRLARRQLALATIQTAVNGVLDDADAVPRGTDPGRGGGADDGEEEDEGD